MTKRAIVFVANDNVYMQTVAFLESLAQNSPGIPLVCIPYDERMEQIDILQTVYNFSYHTDFDFRAFMEISKIVLGKPVPRLRKLGVFTVPVDEFMSLDTDIIVLQDLRPVFGHVGAEKEADIIYFDVSAGCTYYTTNDPLISHTKEISAGAFVSTRSMFNYRRHVCTIMENFSDFRRLANVIYDDQAFGSFVFDLEHRRYKSASEVSHYSNEIWYKHSFSYQDGVLISPSTGLKVPMIHFAGVNDAEGYANAERFRDVALHYQEAGEKRVAAELAARNSSHFHKTE